VWAATTFLDLIAQRYGSFAVTGIMAHEWGHMVQGNVGGAAAELQADCLAGAHFKWAGLGEAEIRQFEAANADNGGPDKFGVYTHGTGPQRVKAARAGYTNYQRNITYTRQTLLAQVCPYGAQY
jgi:predicted metalloprotease